MYDIQYLNTHLIYVPNVHNIYITMMSVSPAITMPSPARFGTA